MPPTSPSLVALICGRALLAMAAGARVIARSKTQYGWLLLWLLLFSMFVAHLIGTPLAATPVRFR